MFDFLTKMDTDRNFGWACLLAGLGMDIGMAIAGEPGAWGLVFYLFAFLFYAKQRDAQIANLNRHTDETLWKAIALYDDAVDMMFDGPDDSDEEYAKARWREARKLLQPLAAALSQQEAAPSVSDCGEAGHDEGRCGNAGCAPVSEPAAHPDALPDGTFSKSTMKRHAALRADAASGEGLPELPKCAAAYMHGCNDDLADGTELFTAEQMRAYAIEARRLTTTGQGDVERLVEAAREAVGCLRGCEVLLKINEQPTTTNLREALAPFGQQQEGS